MTFLTPQEGKTVQGVPDLDNNLEAIGVLIGIGNVPQFQRFVHLFLSY